jgi:hypothetical protein
MHGAAGDETSGLVGSAGGRLVRVRPVDPSKPLAVYLPHQDPSAFFARITDKYSGLVSCLQSWLFILQELPASTTFGCDVFIDSRGTCHFVIQQLVRLSLDQHACSAKY